MLCAAALAASIASGCTDPVTHDDTCLPGELVVCECPDGDGAALCRDDGTTTACICPATTRAVEHACSDCDEDTAAKLDAAAAASDSQAPPIDEPPAPAARCCHELGACLPLDFIPSADRGSFQRADCDDVELACVPDRYLQADALRLQPCRSLGQVEGRCVLDCMPGLAAQSGVLPRDLCDAHELCVPCFDPVTGVPSGVCALGQDPGPAEPPVLFGRCCGDEGACVPTALVAGSGAESDALVADSCDAARGLVCVPDALREGLATCHAFQRAEGRCVPACMLQSADTSSLSQDTCSVTQRCIPCVDPLSGAATGACSLGDDPGPTPPAFVFPSCCTDGATSLGRCVPRTLLPDSAASLPTLECTTPGDACAPSSLLASPNAELPSCRGRFGSEGRCLPQCMVDANLAPLLVVDVCSQAELCVPCRIGTQATGVCPEP